MKNRKDLVPGDELTNNQLVQIFKCGNQGGMRRSLETNTLVIVSNHVESIYNDRWIDGVFHYTGMGSENDQSLKFMQNKTLNNIRTNGVSVHLFEVYEPKIYTYSGEVVFDSPPYEERQTDKTGKQRNVWIFPLKLNSGDPPVISIEKLRKFEKRKLKQVKALSDSEIAKKARQTQRQIVGNRSTLVSQHQRSPYVAEYAKRRAKGKCELCETLAPFKDKNEVPYLETHHIKWLAKGGPDTIENTAALCPNCHRKMHIINDANDREKLLKNAKIPL